MTRKKSPAGKKAGPSLAGLLTEKTIRTLADSGSYQRGVSYCRNGHVTDIIEYRERIVATVVGNEQYRVKLAVADGEIEASCSCPYGSEVECCKHCVATALAWLQLSTEKGKSSAPAGPTLEDVENMLLEKEKSELVEMVMDHVLEDRALRQRLMRQVARTAMKTTAKGAGAFRALIDQAIDQAAESADHDDGYGDYGYDEYDSGVDTEGLSDVVDSLGERLAAGGASDVIDLTEYALERIQRELEELADYGEMPEDIMQALQNLHLKACKKVRPEPKALAEKLFRFEVEGIFNPFSGNFNAYKNVLGREGRARYQELAEQEWKSLPKLTPGNTGSYDQGRYRITAIMKQIIESTGDIDMLVTFESHDLGSSDRYLTIAKIYHSAGRHDEALRWAEEGLSRFGHDRYDGSLVTFLMNEYERRGEHDRVVGLAWKEFVKMPSLPSFRELKKRAGKKWPEWKLQAIELVRGVVAAANRKPSAPESALHGSSLLVELLLDEKENDAAWQAALDGGTHDGLWTKLAGMREKSDPDDALMVYTKQVDRLAIAGQYPEAVELLKRIRPLMKKSTTYGRFPDYLAHLRTEYKRRRNFMALLDEAFPKGV